MRLDMTVPPGHEVVAAKIRGKGCSILDFENLTVGAGVPFFLSEGDQGPQASTVRLVDKPGIHPRPSP